MFLYPMAMLLLLWKIKSEIFVDIGGLTKEGRDVKLKYKKK